LSNEAASLYESFYNRNTNLSNQNQNDYFKAMFAKLDIACLRLAIVLHCSKWAMTGEPEQQVTPETMEAAIQITEYYRITGTKVFNSLKHEAATQLDKKEVAKFEKLKQWSKIYE
jgi:hypothetical protein